MSATGSRRSSALFVLLPDRQLDRLKKAYGRGPRQAAADRSPARSSSAGSDRDCRRSGGGRSPGPSRRASGGSHELFDRMVTLDSGARVFDRPRPHGSGASSGQPIDRRDDLDGLCRHDDRRDRRVSLDFVASPNLHRTRMAGLRGPTAARIPAHRSRTSCSRSSSSSPSASAAVRRAGAGAPLDRRASASCSPRFVREHRHEAGRGRDRVGGAARPASASARCRKCWPASPVTRCRASRSMCAKRRCSALSAPRNGQDLTWKRSGILLPDVSAILS